MCREGKRETYVLYSYITPHPGLKLHVRAAGCKEASQKVIQSK